MRKIYSFFIALMILIGCVYIIIPIIKYDKTQEREMQSKLIESEQYLSQKYSSNMKLLNYSLKDSFVANYCLAENPDIKFSVKWWVNHNEFNDDFLQQCLTDELKKDISKKLSEIGVVEFNVHIGTMTGPPRDLTKRLFKYYQKYRRPPKISEINTAENFMYITVEAQNEYKDLIYYALSDMNLPTKKLDIKPFSH